MNGHFHFMHQEMWQNPKSALITFGQPRIGNSDLADLHDKHIGTYRKLRFINEKDAVPHIPLWPWYHHHSRYGLMVFLIYFINCQVNQRPVVFYREV